MNKVVYNNGYGGFGLSVAAVRWLEENGSEKIKSYLKNIRNNKEQYVQENDELSKMLNHDYNESTMAYKLEYDYDEQGIKRHDQDLINCVEAIGADANGIASTLAIKTIEGNQYIINDYDGWESVVEPKDINWITIE